MTAFVIGSLLLVLIALAFVAPALWRGTRRTLLALALLLPVATIGLYALVGEPQALDPVNVKAPETLEDAIAMVERELEREPGNVEGWVLLGRSRMAQERWAEARDAFARANTLVPDEPDLMVEYADAQMRAAPDRRYPPEAVALLERVVAGRPGHQRALFYLGAARVQADRPAEAVALWEQLLPLVDAGTAQALGAQIEMARERAGMPAGEAVAAVPAGPRLEVRVDLDPALAASLPQGATLFVFARTPDGAGLPVAVKRLAASGFPITLELSDADGLMPAQKLSGQAQVRLMARISRSGDAAAAAGDLEAEALVVDVVDGASHRLLVNRVVP